MAKTSARGRAGARKTGGVSGKPAEPYVHEQTAPMRPDVGTQAQFRKKKPPVVYRYDSSLSPSLDWDGQPRHVRPDDDGGRPSAGRRRAGVAP